MKIENNRKETPHAIVLRSNYEPLIRLFSLYLGQKQLKELTEDTTNKTDSKLMNSSLDITPFI
ncbi:unnamed protein product [Trichobilharzia regenti]|nr:unnamed protein product [Trichobilharzia regenti]